MGFDFSRLCPKWNEAIRKLCEQSVKLGERLNRIRQQLEAAGLTVVIDFYSRKMPTRPFQYADLDQGTVVMPVLFPVRLPKRQRRAWKALLKAQAKTTDDWRYREFDDVISTYRSIAVHICAKRQQIRILNDALRQVGQEVL